jgi:hypothetical protein
MKQIKRIQWFRSAVGERDIRSCESLNPSRRHGGEVASSLSLVLRLVGLLAVSSIIGSLLHPAAAASGQTSQLVPGNEGGVFVVEDALEQFSALKHHGEAIGWWNDESRGASDPSSGDHYQGVARYPGVGVPVFYVTQKADPGTLHIARLGTRSQDGERLRSNLQQIGRDTKSTTPPGLPDETDDTWVSTDTWAMQWGLKPIGVEPKYGYYVYPIRFDGSLQANGLTLHYEHPGGMAIVDDILFVSLDTPLGDATHPGAIALFDLSDDPNDPDDGPESPTLINALPLQHKIDNLAVTTWGDDSYLLWVNGSGGNVTKFYTTSTSDLRAPDLTFNWTQDWEPSGAAGPGDFRNCPWPNCTWPGRSPSVDECAHQSSTFLREPDGSLYLIGMRHGGTHDWFICASPDVGRDFADLYQVTIENGRFTLTLTHTKHLYCVYDGGGQMRICNFGAGNNAYVSPSGELILYSVPHDDEDGFSPDIVRMGEFRHRDVTRTNNPLRTPIADAGGPYTVEEGGAVVLEGTGQPSADRPWVELYDDNNFEDRSIVFDFDFHQDMEFWNFNNLDGFNDKTTSIRWRTPVGLNVRVFDDDGFSDRNLVIGGRGRTQEISNVKTQVVTDCVADPSAEVCVRQCWPAKSVGLPLEFNDKTSSMRFYWTVSEDDVPTEIVVRYRHPDYGGDSEAVAEIESKYELVYLKDESSLDPTLLVRRYQIPSGDAHDAERLLNGVLWPPNDSCPAMFPSGLPFEPAVRSVEPGSLVHLAWDLDGDGSFGEMGAEATRGDELGGSPTFLATEIDGPSQVVVTLHATGSGNPGAASAVIDVANVEPVATIEKITDETGAEIGVDVPFALVGLTIDMTASFTDPGVLDTHTASVDWGDGTIADLGDVVETVGATHAYLAAWDYIITLAVEDDDGRIGTATSRIAVVDARGGISWVVDLLRSLANHRNVRRAIARLEGEASARAANGAIDLLEKGKLNAATGMIKQAMEYLEAAEAADPSLDLGLAKNLLVLSAKSVAVNSVTQAEATATRANALRKVQQASDLIAEGDGLLVVSDLGGALERYRRAVRVLSFANAPAVRAGSFGRSLLRGR